MSTTRPFFIVCVLASLIFGIGLYAGTALPRAMTPEVTAGMNIWQANRCEGCHALYGQGGPYAPDLTHITDQRGPDYLREFLVNPGTSHPGQRIMPAFGLTKTETDSLLAFLQWVSEQNTGWPPRPILIDSRLSGER